MISFITTAPCLLALLLSSGLIYGQDNPPQSTKQGADAALASVAVFYFVTVWIMIGAAGADHVQAFAKEKSGDFLFDLTTQYGGDLLTTFAGLFFVTSLLAAYLALHNAASKYMFAARGRRPLAHASDAGPSALSVADRRKLPDDRRSRR